MSIAVDLSVTCDCCGESIDPESADRIVVPQVHRLGDEDARDNLDFLDWSHLAAYAGAQ